MPKVSVISGASAGVGRATARRFAEDGGSIGLIARDASRLSRAVDEIQEAGSKGAFYVADAADAEAMEKAAAYFERELGPIDIWINVAMATIFAPFLAITPEEYRRATEVTYLGYVYGTMAALRRMKERDRGVIVQVGSALAYRSIPLQAPYCGAKHAIVGFTDSVRSELIHEDSHVKLTVVQLPAVNTPQFDWGRNKMPRRPRPLPPIYQPEVAASAIHFAAHHPRRELWLGWSSVTAILAQKIVPGVLDRMLARKAYGGQQASEPALDRSDNLFNPVAGDYGAHGRFDAEARSMSSEFWLAKHARAVIALCVALCATAAVAAISII